MKKKSKSGHVISTFSISDTTRFYERLAEKGCFLKKCGYLLEEYSIDTPEKMYFSIVPKNLVISNDIKNIQEGWELLTENRKYRIYISKENLSKISYDIDFSLREISMNLLGLIFLPICFYYLGNDVFFNNMKSGGTVLGTMYIVLAIFFCSGYVLSLAMGSAEALYLKHTGQCFSQNSNRFNICLFINNTLNICHVLLLPFLIYIVTR